MHRTTRNDEGGGRHNDGGSRMETGGGARGRHGNIAGHFDRWRLRVGAEGTGNG
uniref:Uncharacterized protein n=1 Tax=Arundo donax TaxID=35708 RepID=A0A0A9ETH9_ARUDO